jgi:sporulation protein YlmC with PRC-barrel domain
MKTTSKKSLVCMAAATLALAGSVLADSGDLPKTPPNQNTSQNQSSGANPARYNKASGIIGMDVRNQNDEHLGRIKDVVFDLRNERVSYAVMTTSPRVALGIDEKLLAVPLNALTVSADEKHLILNADKSKVEAAEGFTKNNWPAVVNPSWGAQPFWQSNGDKSYTTRPDNKPDQKSDQP